MCCGPENNQIENPFEMKSMKPKIRRPLSEQRKKDIVGDWNKGFQTENYEDEYQNEGHSKYRHR